MQEVAKLVLELHHSQQHEEFVCILGHLHCRKLLLFQWTLLVWRLSNRLILKNEHTIKCHWVAFHNVKFFIINKCKLCIFVLQFQLSLIGLFIFNWVIFYFSTNLNWSQFHFFLAFDFLLIDFSLLIESNYPVRNLKFTVVTSHSIKIKFLFIKMPLL